MRAPPLVLALLPCAALVVACGGAHDATEKQIADLRSEVVKLRADNAALAERLDGVELRGRPRAAPPAAGPAEVAAREQPDLDVVRLAPEGGASEDPDAEGPRPVLRGTGKTGSIEQAGARPATPAAAAKPGVAR